MTTTNKQQGDRYELYLRQFNYAKDLADRLSQNEDKLTLTISSGALVLSVTFINTIITAHGSLHLFYLVGSWVLLIATIVFNLISVLLSYEGTVKYINKLNKWLDTDKPILPDVNDPYFNIANWLSRISYLFLVLGIISMTIFAWHNINSLIPNK